MTALGLLLAAALLAGGDRAGADGERPRAAPGRPSADPPRGTPEPRDDDTPPPGTRADQDLWKAAHDGNSRVVVVRSIASRLQVRAKGNGYLGRLDALARQGGEAEGRACPPRRADPRPPRFRRTVGFSAMIPLVRRGANPVLALPVAVLLCGAAPAGDAALLSDMRAAHLGLTGERGKAHLLLGELNSVRYDEKLAARAKGEDPASERAAAARVKLVTAWHRLFEAVGGPQPVDPRGACRIEERTLREALAGAPGSAAAARVPAAREDAKACLARLTSSLDKARTRRAALDAALAEAKSLLATPAEAGK